MQQSIAEPNFILEVICCSECGNAADVTEALPRVRGAPVCLLCYEIIYWYLSAPDEGDSPGSDSETTGTDDGADSSGNQYGNDAKAGPDASGGPSHYLCGDDEVSAVTSGDALTTPPAPSGGHGAVVVHLRTHASASTMIQPEALAGASGAGLGSPEATVRVPLELPSEQPSVLPWVMPESGNGTDFSIGLSAARGTLQLAPVRWSDVVASSRPNF